MLGSSIRISKLYAPTILNTNFIKWLPIGFNLGSSWLGTLVLITTTHCSTANRESLKVLYTCSLSLGITLDTFQFPETGEVFSNSTLRVVSTLSETNHHLFNHHKHSTHIKLCHLAHGRSEGKLSNSWGNKRKS